MTCKAKAIGLLIAGTAFSASAQIGMGHGVFATGAGLMSNGTYAAAGTMGQCVIGRSVGAAHASSAGFWGDGGVILDVETPGPTVVPATFALKQNYPNPFNPTTQIVYDVPGRMVQGAGASYVRLTVYDVLGREVAVLVDEQKGAGSHTVQFDASGLATGAYVYRMTAGDFVQTLRMMLVK
jgi:hypothetical protein